MFSRKWTVELAGIDDDDDDDDDSLPCFSTMATDVSSLKKFQSVGKAFKLVSKTFLP